MDVRQLKYFLAIADAGSMTKASEQLHISGILNKWWKSEAMPL